MPSFLWRNLTNGHFSSFLLWLRYPSYHSQFILCMCQSFHSSYYFHAFLNLIDECQQTRMQTYTHRLCFFFSSISVDMYSTTDNTNIPKEIISIKWYYSKTNLWQRSISCEKDQLVKIVSETNPLRFYFFRIYLEMMIKEIF